MSSSLKAAGLTEIDLVFVKELINAKDYKSEDVSSLEEENIISTKTTFYIKLENMIIFD